MFTIDWLIGQLCAFKSTWKNIELVWMFIERAQEREFEGFLRSFLLRQCTAM